MRQLTGTRVHPSRGYAQGLATPCCPSWRGTTRACYNMLSVARSSQRTRHSLCLPACSTSLAELFAPEAESTALRFPRAELRVALTPVCLTMCGTTAPQEHGQRRAHCSTDTGTGERLGRRRTGVLHALRSNPACLSPATRTEVKSRKSRPWIICKVRTRRPWWLLPRNQSHRTTGSAKTLDDGEPPSPRDPVHFRVPITSSSANQPQGTQRNRELSPNATDRDLKSHGTIEQVQQPPLQRHPRRGGGRNRSTRV